MQSFFSFLKSRQFFVHFGLVLLTLFLVFFITTRWLSSYTDHNEFVVVPDFKSKMMAELDNFVSGKEVSYQVVDSIYDPKEKPGMVIRQEPEANSKVKHNRIIYLYVTGMVAPQIEMPKLIDRSERQAKLIIETYGLKMGHITSRAADCNGCVLAQLVKGKEVQPGKNIKKGSVIDLVVGRKDFSFSAAADTSKSKGQEAPDFDNN